MKGEAIESGSDPRPPPLLLPPFPQPPPLSPPPLLILVHPLPLFHVFPLATILNNNVVKIECSVPMSTYSCFLSVALANKTANTARNYRQCGEPANHDFQPG